VHAIGSYGTGPGPARLALHALSIWCGYRMELQLTVPRYALESSLAWRRGTGSFCRLPGAAAVDPRHPRAHWLTAGLPSGGHGSRLCPRAAQHL